MDTPKKVARNRHPDRITLSVESLGKIGRWSDQIASELRGVAVTRSDLVNWMIGRQSETLNATDFAELRQLFFDEVRFAQWAVRELRNAKQKGEAISLADLIKSPRPAKKSPARKKSVTTRGDQVAQTEQSQNELT